MSGRSGRASRPSSGPCIVVGYDGSEPARAAVTYAAKRAGKNGQVIVVNAFGGPSEPHGRAVLDALLLEEGNVLMDTDFELELVDGPPAQALVKLAQDRDADEIVLGSRGFGRLRASLGSVSHDVLHRADRPVVLIPYGAVRAHAGAQS